MASIRYLTLITHDKCEKLWLLFDDRLGKRFLFHPALFFGRKPWPHFKLNSVCMQNANVKKAISKIINLIIIMEVNWF